MEAVPFIRRGKGNDPSDGGCILQIVDWVSTGGWTDSPKCVLPAIQGVAIHLNDNLDDHERQKLLDLVPRLMNTNVSGVNKKIEDAAARYNERWYGPDWKNNPWARTENPNPPLGAIWELLLEMLDIVDQHLERTEHEPIDLTDVCAVMATTTR